MFVFLAQLILVFSVGGILLLVAHKIPVLVTLQEETTKRGPKKREWFWQKIKKSNFLLNFLLKQEIFYKFWHKPHSFFLQNTGKKLRYLKKFDLKKDGSPKQKKLELEGDYWEKIRDWNWWNLRGKIKKKRARR